MNKLGRLYLKLCGITDGNQKYRKKFDIQQRTEFRERKSAVAFAEESDRRCKAGQATKDEDCIWHNDHYWCEECHGWYGVPHDNQLTGLGVIYSYGCHSKEFKATGYVYGWSGYCACRYHENKRQTLH